MEGDGFASRELSRSRVGAGLAEPSGFCDHRHTTTQEWTIAFDDLGKTSLKDHDRANVRCRAGSHP